MNREVLLFELLAAFCGPLIGAAGFRRGPEALLGNGSAVERLAWRRLWMPVLPGILCAALFMGWSMQEPDFADEWPRPGLSAVALVFVGIWVRALVRAVLALDLGDACGSARTVGLLMPQVQIDPAFASVLDPDALRAVAAHEAAHARHRDPLRILMAQFVTDLQWPFSAAQNRLSFWLHALEIARDEEARVCVAGEDLAAAILVAVRQAPSPRRRRAAAFLTDSEALRDRIGRLLSPLIACATPRRSLIVVGVGAACAAFVAFGAVAGEHVIRALPGIVH